MRCSPDAFRLRAQTRTEIAIERKESKQPKQLPAPNGDFYQLKDVLTTAVPKMK
jgi:hypothetical protein